MTDHTGEQLGNYRLVRQLGQGGFASVYLGEHCHLGTQAAIKLLHGPLQHADVQAFREEARMIAQLQHPHIIRVLDYALEGQTPYLVMDYATQGTLRQRHPRGMRVEPSVLLPYLAQVGQALQHAHRYKVIHRDVKPENLLVGAQGQVLLSDFGIATLAQSQALQTGPVAGTATYMAPEQTQGKPVCASDQYALGIMLYEWLTGQLPFQGTPLEILSQHALKSPPPLRQLVPDLPAAIEVVVFKALAKRPNERYLSIQSLVHDFEEACKGKQVNAVLQAAKQMNTGKTAPAKPPPPRLIPPGQELPLTALEQPQMQARALTCLRELGVEPTPEQQQMLFSPASSLSVLAGAGSGKSTTLVWRVLLMNKLLGIPLDQLHVFSFSRDSAAEVRSKLLTKLLAWETLFEGHPPSAAREKDVRTQLKRTVTTFHSELFQLKKKLFPGNSLPLFDLAGDPASQEASDAMADYNPFVTQLSKTHILHLRAAHTKAYYASSRYRSLVDSLVEETERRAWVRLRDGRPVYAERDETAWALFLQREWQYQGFDEQQPRTLLSQDAQGIFHADPYRAALADQLRLLGKSFTTWTSFLVNCPMAGMEPGEMLAAFQVDHLYLHVDRFTAQEPGKLCAHERTRKQIIVRYSETPDHHRFFARSDFHHQNGKLTLSVAGMHKLMRWVRLQHHAKTLKSAPSPQVELPGAMRRDLYEVLYQEGLFCESLGAEVSALSSIHPSELDESISAMVAELLPLFWEALEAQLKPDFLRFHTILRQLRSPGILLPLEEQIQHLRHVLIDEFQDISPEIVGWLVLTHQLLRNKQASDRTSASVVGIGDDYQSIYAWRGSHPGYLLFFEHIFKAQDATQLPLQINFRSRQPIIAAAEALLEGVVQKSAKQGISFAQEWETRCQVPPVKLCVSPLCWHHQPDQTTIWMELSNHALDVLLDLQAALGRLPLKDASLTVKIVARTNHSLTKVPDEKLLAQELSDRLKHGGIQGIKRVTVEKTTVHRAKGLEADMVLLVDDIVPPTRHPLRERVYQLASMPGSYGVLLHEEARRLAYVALTRARLGLLWVPCAMKGASNEDSEEEANGEESGPELDPQGAFLIVKRVLKAQMSPALTASGAADSPG